MSRFGASGPNLTRTLQALVHDPIYFQAWAPLRVLLASLPEPHSCRRSPAVIRGMPPACPLPVFTKKRDVTGRVTGVSTAPKMKPVKDAGNQEIDVLAGLNHLLAEDFRICTWEHQQAATAALRENPSHWQLICAVRRWAV